MGTDVSAPVGQPVRALADGTALLLSGAGTSDEALQIRHKAADGTDFVAIYGHIDAKSKFGSTTSYMEVSVSKGEQIGVIRSHPMGSHLHLGIWNSEAPKASGWGRRECVSGEPPVNSSNNSAFRPAHTFLRDHPVNGSGEGMDSGPVILADGRLFVFARGSDGKLWHRVRVEETNSWDPWRSRGKPDGVNLAGTPEAIVSDGHLFVFVRASDGKLYYRNRRESDHKWDPTGWKPLGKPSGVSLSSTPEAIVSDGHMFVFVRASDGEIYYRNRIEADNKWNTEGWKPLGKPSGVNLQDMPEAIVSDGHMFVFMRANNGKLYYRNRIEAENRWDPKGWKPLGAPGGQFINYSPNAVNSDGHMFVFVRAGNGEPYYRNRSEADHLWDPEEWKPLEKPDTEAVFSTPEAIVSAGHMFVFQRSQHGNLVYRNRIEASHQWDPGGWKSREKPPGSSALHATPQAAVSDGHMFVFIRSSDGTIRYQNRVSGDNAWDPEGWKTLNRPSSVQLMGFD